MAIEADAPKYINFDISVAEQSIIIDLEERRNNGEDVEEELQIIYNKIRDRNSNEPENVRWALNHYFSTFKLADPSTQRARMETCRSCEYARKIGPNINNSFSVIQCKKCNCLMNVKTKLQGTKCPEGKF